MKRLRALKSFQIFNIEIKKSKTYSRTVPLKYPVSKSLDMKYFYFRAGNADNEEEFMPSLNSKETNF